MERTWDAKTLLEAVNLALPNISRFLRNDLKNEKLTGDSERARLRYETLMTKLETAASGGPSLTSGDSSREISPAPASTDGVHRRRHTTADFPVYRAPQRVSADYDYLPKSPSPVPDVMYSSFLLVKDSRKRWHRHWCRVDGVEQRFRTMDSTDHKKVTGDYIIAGSELLTGPEVNAQHDKDLTIVIVLPADGDRPKEEVIVAAYDSHEYNKWREALSAVIYPDRSSSRGTRRTTVHGISSRDRESFLSSITTSSGYVSPISTRPPDDLPRRPKDDPLPSLPIEEKTRDSDTETIYEEIDALQEMVDQQLKKADLLLEPLRGNKKWRNSLPSFSGFITRLKRNSIRTSTTTAPTQLIPRPAVNQEESDEYRGYLFKQSSKLSTLWKKKWCVLRHCIFAYYDTPDDIEGHSVVLLGYNVESVQDKRAYVFKLSSDSNKDLFFAAENEEEFLEWSFRLDSATKAFDQEIDDDFACDWMNEKNEEMNSTFNGSLSTTASVDSRRFTMDSSLQYPHYGMNSGGDGIYDVPRSSLAPFGGKIFPVARTEGIYDVPNNIPLMRGEDDYDYPPDALELFELSSSMTTSTVQSMESLMSKSSSGSDEHSKKMSVKGPVLDRSQVVYTPGELKEMLSDSNPYAEVKKRPKGEPQMDFSSCTQRGNLFKRDRFQWSKVFCAIRGSFFELYKNDSLAIKILLPSAEVMKDSDSRRPWSFKIKQSKKEDVHLAAESAVEYQKWIDALESASSIKIQSVDDLSTARVVDPDFRDKWDSLDRLARDSYRSRSGTAPLSTKDIRSSFKTKRKLSDIKFKFRNKSRKEVPNSTSASNLQKLSVVQSNESLGESGIGDLSSDVNQPGMRRSLSLTAVTSNNQFVGSSSRTRKVYSSLVRRFIRGWLQVQLTKVKNDEEQWKRAYCVLENLKFFCFTDEGCDELITTLSLKGSRVSRASQECNADYMFKIWQLSNSKIIYLRSESQDEFTKWMEVATNGADYVLPDDTADSSQSLHRTPSFYYFPPEFEYPDCDSMSISMDGISSYSSYDSLASTTTNQGVVHYQGLLKRKNDIGKWMDRHCCIKDDRLLLYYTSSDLTPLSSLALTNATLAVVHDKASSLGFDAFTIRPVEGIQKTMMFACPSQNELWRCLAAIYEASQQTVKMSNQDLTKLQQTIKDQRLSGQPKSPRKVHREPQLTVPFSKLTNILHSGMVNVKMDKEPWTKYWCAVTDLYFHIYQTASSQVAVQVSHLPGSRIQLVGSASRGYMILLEQSSHPPMFITSEDKDDFGKWFSALETGIQRRAPEGGEITRGDESKESRRRRKAPRTQKESKRDAVMRQFEKNVKKTRKVARKADQNLKQQHMSLLYIRRELDKHVLRLQERTDNGDEHAIAAAEALAGKAVQIEQVLPYLEKCIKVNRQAELQTIAVLQKGREEAMRELDQIHPEGNTGEIPKIVEEGIGECDQKDTCDDLESTLTESIRTPSKDATSSPVFTRSTSTPAHKEITPPKPLKLHRTHTTESSTSQNSEIFIPKGSILSPQDFVKHAWHRPNSAKSQSSEGDCATPLATSPMVLSPRRFKRSQSSGQPNKMSEGTEVEGNGMLHRPTSASSNRIHMTKLMLQGSPGTEL